MRIAGIDFPENLLTARKEKKLVVFAGAGVSIPPPSNYPNFRELANRVAQGVLTLGENEPVDHFLGRLQDQQIAVHQLVSRILSNPESKPDSLHFDLLRLFESPESLRLVTTNFDLHFSTAANEVFASEPPCETYYAPALPLGHSFSGIVYLHGGVNKPAERLVLTDSDFGRAYLTEGWARLFLQRVFETFTVLFVGYSHNDPVMNYLARGYTPEMGKARRFALTPSEDEERWTYRGVLPVSYRLAPGENPHSALPLALATWAEQAHLGLLEKEQRIKTIVALPPPIEPELGDFVEEALSEIATTRFFTRHADSVPWMKWLEEKNLLKRLFDPRATLTDVDRELAWWIADKYQCKHPGEALSLIRRQGQHLNATFWLLMAHKLSLDWSKGGERSILRRWLTVLMNLRPLGTSCERLEHAAASFLFPDDTEAALLLFEFLTRPMLRLKHDLWSEIGEVEPREDVRFELESTGGGFWLDHFWRKFFLPNLADLSERLEPIVWSHLQLAHSLSHADKGIEGSWDGLSLSRNLIEESDHGRINGGLGVLIDAAFNLINWSIQNRPVRSDALIELWFSSDSFLLKRLSILAVALSAHWSADRKMQWLLERDLLYARGLKHEVFTVLKNAYPRSSEDLRTATIARASQGYKPVPVGAERTAEYEKYNLILWLHESDPNCPDANAAFSEIQAAHSDFGARGRPDLDVEFGPVQVGLQSPLGVEELLSKPPGAHIEFLLSYEPDRPFGPSRDGLADNLTTAAVRDYTWSWELAQELQRREALKPDIWAALIRGWASSVLRDTAWHDVLTLLDSTNALHGRLVTDIANLLEDGVKKAEQPIPSDCFAVAADLSKKLWRIAAAKPSPEKPVPEPDWVMRAINHPAGRLTLFWLSWLARLWKERDSDWKAIPAWLREIFESVVADDSYAGELGRVLLASQLNLLFRVDEAWTKEQILPLFDWTLDGKRALHAFHGFLTWGHQTEELLPYLVPMYQKSFSHITELGKVRDRFVEYMAGLAVTSSVNPLENGWLDRFMLASQEQDRQAWASRVEFFLRGLNEAGRTRAWQSWIKEYWNRRILGLPVIFEPVELGKMVEWSPFLASGFPEAAETVWKSPKFELRDSFIFRELADTDLPERYPVAAGRLVLKVLQNMQAANFDLDRVDDLLRRILPLGSPKLLLRKVCGELARLGYPSAGDLEALINAPNRPEERT